MSRVLPNGDGGTVPPVAEHFLIHPLNNFFSWNHTIKRSFVAVVIDAVYIFFYFHALFTHVMLIDDTKPF